MPKTSTKAVQSVKRLTYIDPVVPNGHNCEGIPDSSHCQISNEEQEVAIVLSSEAIIDPRAVMVHSEDTSLAHAAV